MNKVMCIDMGYSSRALCLAIWRLITTQRFNDAMKTNTLYTTIHQISVEDPTIEQDWPMVCHLDLFKVTCFEVNNFLQVTLQNNVN